MSTEAMDFLGPYRVDDPGAWPPRAIERRVPVTRIVDGHLKPSVGWRVFVRYPCYSANLEAA